MFELFDSKPIKNDKNISLIQKFEEENEVCFPYALAYIYSYYNVDSIPLLKFDIDGYRMEVRSFFRLDGDNNIFNEYSMQLKNGFIDKRFVPFAFDRGGNVYYFDSKKYKASCYEKCPVYYISSDDVENPDMITDNIVEFLSNIFDSLLSKQEMEHLTEWIREQYFSADDILYNNCRNKLLEFVRSI